jgi:hypothetical protein
MVMRAVSVLAQTAEEVGTPLPLILFYIGIPAFSLVAVGVACWVFWRAKQRDDAAMRLEAERNTHDDQRKELTWRNARSS